MACTYKAHVGDIGTDIVLTIYETSIIDGEETSAILDISDATVLKIKAVHQSGRNYFYEDLVFVTDGTDGKAHFITTADSTFDISGKYNIQAYYEGISGKWSTTSFVIDVLPVVNIPTP